MGAVSQSFWLLVGVNGRGVTLVSAVSTANDVSMPSVPPQPLDASAPITVVFSVSSGAFEIS